MKMFPWKVFALLVPSVLIIDLLWLGVIMKNFYAQEIGAIMRKQGDSLAPRWDAALLVYLLIPAGLILFVRPIIGTQATLSQAFGYGGLFGLILYGVYDMTNLSVLEKWTYRVAFADMAWGCVLCGITSILMLVMERWLKT
jgi:uncharacterized membrane protein